MSANLILDLFADVLNQLKSANLILDLFADTVCTDSAVELFHLEVTLVQS